jgi:hypothetical protein
MSSKELGLVQDKQIELCLGTKIWDYDVVRDKDFLYFVQDEENTFQVSDMTVGQPYRCWVLKIEADGIFACFQNDELIKVFIKIPKEMKVWHSLNIQLDVERDVINRRKEVAAWSVAVAMTNGALPAVSKWIKQAVAAIHRYSTPELAPFANSDGSSKNIHDHFRYQYRKTGDRCFYRSEEETSHPTGHQWFVGTIHAVRGNITEIKLDATNDIAEYMHSTNQTNEFVLVISSDEMNHRKREVIERLIEEANTAHEATIARLRTQIEKTYQE